MMQYALILGNIYTSKWINQQGWALENISILHFAFNIASKSELI